MASSTPSTVMFVHLKRLGVSNADAARVLYDSNHTFGKMTLGERIGKRALLSRTLVHVEPGIYSRRFFDDFATSAQVLSARLISKNRHGKRRNAVVVLEDYLRSQALPDMHEAFVSYGLQSEALDNAAERIAHSKFSGKTDRLMLYLVLFIAAGCLGDADEAAMEVEQFAHDTLSESALTPATQYIEFDSGDDAPAFGGDCHLGVIRLFDGMTMKEGNGLHVLSESRQGTVIGAVGCDITDVDEQVSRCHARIWKEGKRWYIEGLGSTNGTAVISGADKSVYVVEPPRSQRASNYKSVPYEIVPADIICLGQSTRFWVQAVTG